jgi:hypothetical protein
LAKTFLKIITVKIGEIPVADPSHALSRFNRWIAIK